MQFQNWHNWHGHVSSSADSADGGDDSLPGQGFMSGSADGSPASWAMPQEYLMDFSGQVSPVYGAATHAPSTSSATTAAAWSRPAPTLVGSATGLQFDLIWASSVANAPRVFMQAIAAAVVAELVDGACVAAP
jgi:hypothetical protein